MHHSYSWPFVARALLKNLSNKGNRKLCSMRRMMETEGSRVAAVKKLTAAEKRVLALVSSAKTNKEIAFALNISPATIKRHLENILRKLSLKNRVEAAIYGLIVNGCPNGPSSDCPLELWHRARTHGEAKWAI
jgi:DNA-binding NarL/FixJ family response regulator